MLNSATIQDFTWKSRKSSLNWQTPGFTFTSMEQSPCNISGTVLNPLMGILSEANGTKEGLQYRGEQDVGMFGVNQLHG